MLTSPTLKSSINSLWDRFWSGGISNPATAIEQMSYLIFLKRLEDMDNTRANTARRRNAKHISIFIDHEDCRWSYWSQLPGDEMLKHVRDVVFDFLRNMGEAQSAFTQFMNDAVFIIPKASLLQEAVKIIDGMHISEQNMDVQGDMYEYLLGQLTTAGKNGQFRTPRHIIRMITKLVNPEIGNRVCDPACGTSGFLVAAYEHILEMNTSPEILEYDEEGKAHHLIGDKIADPKLHEMLKSKAFTGYDFDSTMVRIAAMNLMLHGIDNPNIKNTDTLSKTFNEAKQYDIILANPPFKGSIDESDINPRFRVKTGKTELLFIELIHDLLVTGGKAGVIVPDGVLFGSSNAHVDVRKILIDQCKLEGIISMPSGVFKPYAGVSTAVLIFTKGGITDNVWFYDMQADGFSLDDKRQPTEANDIPDIIEKWKSRNGDKNLVGFQNLRGLDATVSPGSKKSKLKIAAEPEPTYQSSKAGSEGIPLLKGAGGFDSRITIVPAAEIRANKYDLSLSRYKTVTHETIVYEKPNVLMNRILELENEIGDLVREIKEEME